VGGGLAFFWFACDGLFSSLLAVFLGQEGRLKGGEILSQVFLGVAPTFPFFIYFIFFFFVYLYNLSSPPNPLSGTAA